jgi:hypothetical protein
VFHNSWHLVTCVIIGDYFGETALLTNANRGATITAAGECTCLTLGRKQFTALFGEDRLNITFAKRAAISAEGGFNPDKKSDNDSKELPPAGTFVIPTHCQSIICVFLSLNVSYLVVCVVCRVM